VRECGERLVDPRDLHPALTLAPRHPWTRHPRTPWVRESVGRVLVEAQERLPEGYRLQVLEGYRSLETQEQLYRYACEQLRGRHPEWPEAELREAANAWIAAPDIASPPPHATGGAVDLALVTADGEPLDMTGPDGWTERTAPTAARGIPGVVGRRRALLCQVLSAAGLTNYPGEWWHWSYGDPGWAVRTGHPYALYGAVEAQILWEI
jgi:D-alanyl-D-alanine dipeptidase